MPPKKISTENTPTLNNDPEKIAILSENNEKPALQKADTE